MDPGQAPAAGATELVSPEQVRSLMDELGAGQGSNLIGVLQDVQGRLGYLPADALAEVARRLRTPLARVYGVVSFYSQFYTAPHGRHTVRVCRGTACHVKGAGSVLDAVGEALGISEGQTTGDQVFYLETVACLGTCFLAPVMMIDNEYFGNLAGGDVEAILKSFRERAS